MFSPCLLLLVLSLCVPLYRCPVTGPIVEVCNAIDASIVCVNHYASILPYGFYRAPINNSLLPTAEPAFEQTLGVNATDPYFELLSKAAFVVYDRHRGLSLLGDKPRYDFIFKISDAVHDGPVYVPETDEFYFSQLSLKLLSQNVINLSASPPTLHNKTASPTLYSAEGGVFHNGLIYYAVAGGNASYHTQPGIYTLNATSGKSEALRNNYFGWYFNGPTDLTFDPTNGDIWFTDNDAAWGNGVNTHAPVLPLQTYRFRPSTELVTVVEDTLKVPNGIAFSPDGKTCYISDTGPVSTNLVQLYPGYQDFNVTSHHAVYAFDVVEKVAGKPYLTNERPIFQSKDWIPDGLKVLIEVYVLTGTGSSVEVLSPEGELLVSIQTNFTAVNVNWAGADLGELWIVGLGGVSRVTGLNIHGQTLRGP